MQFSETLPRIVYSLEWEQLSDEWVLHDTILSWSNGLSSLGFNADLAANPAELKTAID